VYRGVVRLTGGTTWSQTAALLRCVGCVCGGGGFRGGEEEARRAEGKWGYKTEGRDGSEVVRRASRLQQVAAGPMHKSVVQEGTFPGLQQPWGAARRT
jgi:hypothetical protein